MENIHKPIYRCKKPCWTIEIFDYSCDWPRCGGAFRVSCDGASSSFFPTRCFGDLADAVNRGEETLKLDDWAAATSLEAAFGSFPIESFDRFRVYVTYLASKADLSLVIVDSESNRTVLCVKEPEVAELANDLRSIHRAHQRLIAES
ncbi:MAG: hypothetical protein NXI04_03255 [Planctomycetaceae bacterium]|nr:hypothetical protein [Planctomycetaceae bacterium]